MIDFDAVSPDVLRSLREDILASLHVALPGTVTEWDPETKTVTVQPALRCRLSENSDPIALPVIRNVPVFCPKFSDPSLSLSVEPGNFCLLIFADRNIDGWVETGSAVLPPSGRMHDLSDAFAFVGFRGGGSAT